MPRVIDNTVLSNFCRIGRLDPLNALLDEVQTICEQIVGES
jgi:hypothetical protein